MSQTIDFGRRLKDWYAKNKRELPWRGSKDPYTIWLSEVILQQTRIDQGLNYFRAFTLTFPTVGNLAKAGEDQVLKLWEGMGYYSRARNLHKAAKAIMEIHNGEFPKEKQELETLPGIGPYTAAAISSICFGEKALAIDGNIIRVISRFYGITGLRSQKPFLRAIEDASEKIEFSPPGDFNQSLMDLGAMVCTPKTPNCQHCPLGEGCYAFQNEEIAQFPSKDKKTKSRKRYLYYLVQEQENGFLIQQRGENDIWAKLYEFPYFEKDAPSKTHEILTELDIAAERIIEETGFIKHILSHQQIYANFLILQPDSIHLDKIRPSKTRGNYSRKQMLDLPFPRLITNFLEERYSLYGRSK